MEFEFEKTLQTFQLDASKLPRELKNRVYFLTADYKNAGGDSEIMDPKKLRQIKIKDAALADEIQTWAERDYEEETEPIPNNNNNSMSKEKEALIARAKAVGLPETASEAEIAAKEKEISDNNAKADQLKARAKACGLKEDATLEEIEAKEKADKSKSDSDAAEAAKKAAKDKEEADKKAKAKASEDIFDDLDL